MKPSLGTWRECHPTFQLTKHCDYRSRHHSVDDLTVIGSAALVAPATAGSTNSTRTISAHLLTYGEQPSSVVTLERRYGPRRLHDDDDDEVPSASPFFRLCLPWRNNERLTMFYRMQHNMVSITPADHLVPVQQKNGS